MDTMTITELINELEAARVTLGDVPVYMEYEGCYDTVNRVIGDANPVTTLGASANAVFLNSEKEICNVRDIGTKG